MGKEKNSSPYLALQNPVVLPTVVLWDFLTIDTLQQKQIVPVLVYADNCSNLIWFEASKSVNVGGSKKNDMSRQYSGKPRRLKTSFWGCQKKNVEPLWHEEAHFSFKKSCSYNKTWDWNNCYNGDLWRNQCVFTLLHAFAVTELI